jgi:hypothetical protein
LESLDILPQGSRLQESAATRYVCARSFVSRVDARLWWRSVRVLVRRHGLFAAVLVHRVHEFAFSTVQLRNAVLIRFCGLVVFPGFDLRPPALGQKRDGLMHHGDNVL